MQGNCLLKRGTMKRDRDHDDFQAKQSDKGAKVVLVLVVSVVDDLGGRKAHTFLTRASWR
jgi:hypothetical protein